MTDRSHRLRPGRLRRGLQRLRPEPGRFLRRLAGVQEPVLDLIQGERARYTSMGGVVLGTAIVAAVSMLVALSIVFGGHASPAVVLLAGFWGVFVLNFDRWLLSTVVTAGGAARFLRFLPRIVLAVMFGVIIAEPLLLGVFGSTIEKYVHDERAAELRTYEEGLVRCNPPAGPAARPTDCTAGLSITTTPAAAQKSLDEVRRQSDELTQEVADEQRRFDDLSDQASRECLGRGPSQLRGNGPLCKKLQDTADRYQSESRLLEDQDRLVQIQAEMATLIKQQKTDQTRYETDLALRIADMVQQHRRDQGEIGLLTRLRAMSELVAANSYVHSAQWALRVFFVMVDAMPVLVKLIGGVTTYDRLAAARLTRQEQDQRLAEGTEAHRAATEAGVRRYEIDLDAAAERERASAHAERVHRRNQDEFDPPADETQRPSWGAPLPRGTVNGFGRSPFDARP